MIFPSLYEGFGIPILEAQAMGTPVITSNTSSLPEVGGNAAYYVNPYNIDEIARAIANVVFNRQLHQSLSKKSLTNVKRFSCEKAAFQTLAVFD